MFLNITHRLAYASGRIKTSWLLKHILAYPLIYMFQWSDLFARVCLCPLLTVILACVYYGLRFFFPFSFFFFHLFNFAVLKFWHYEKLHWKNDTLKVTLKNDIKEGSTENHTETISLLFRNAKNRELTTFLSDLKTIHKLHRISYNHTET